MDISDFFAVGIVLNTRFEKAFEKNYNAILEEGLKVFIYIKSIGLDSVNHHDTRGSMHFKSSYQIVQINLAKTALPTTTLGEACTLSLHIK